MTEVVKHLIKTVGATRRRESTISKRELTLIAGGVLTGVAVGALFTLIVASRSRNSAD